MATFGLTADGFNRKRQDDLASQIETAILNRVGDVNTDPDSVFGQLIDISANIYSELWQESENLYFSQYINTAEGVNLDNAVALIGIERAAAVPSTVVAAATGSFGTAIPAGSQVQTEDENDVFQNPEEVVIDSNNLVGAVYSIGTVTDNVDYTIIINGNSATYNSGNSPTETSIIDGLVNAINGLGENVTAQRVNGTLEININDYLQNFSATISSNLTRESLTTPITFESVETGPIPAPAGSLTEIVTPVSGWDSINNFVAAFQGANTETDLQLRNRAELRRRALGGGSLPAIRASLLQVVDALDEVRIFENRTNSVDSTGRPPHSFEAVIQGGIDDDIADALWENKPAGIETFGTETINITDSNGDSQPISFSRPQEVYIWFEIDIQIVAGEFPADGTSQMASNVEEFGNNTFSIGDDILYQRFFSQVYDVTGVTDATIRVTTTASATDNPTGFASDNITIGPREISVFNSNRVNINIV